ncbi:MAG: hypothetical protein VYE64_06745 [Planctomycetota bacterium]|nr:hypothetical protein [Planctomycetota bacterium]
MSTITTDQVLAAQQVWGEGVVGIGSAYTNSEDYTQVATEHVNNLYAYGMSGVLFKPTKAAEVQFRDTTESAISYFVGGNANFPEDKGFALQPWTAVRFDNSGIVINGPQAMAMGNYFFTDQDGQETKVEYSFGYVQDENGVLRINLHHSSLPYAP